MHLCGTKKQFLALLHILVCVCYISADRPEGSTHPISNSAKIKQLFAANLNIGEDDHSFKVPCSTN